MGILATKPAAALGASDRKTLYITDSEHGAILRARPQTPGRRSRAQR